MGPDTPRAEVARMVPRFQYDGGNPAKFLRDFPFVASYFGVMEAYEWEADMELDREQTRTNSYAVAVLRQYLTEDVLQVIMVGNPTRASVLYASLKKMFLARDARTMVQVQRDLNSCEMKLGESLVMFLSRINALLNEQDRLGEPVSQEVRMVTVASRLRNPWRQIANDKIDREPGLTYEDLAQFLFLRQRGDYDADNMEGAYVAAGRGGTFSVRGRRGAGRGGQNRRAACYNCGMEGHIKRECPELICFGCGEKGHSVNTCTKGGQRGGSE
jgi:hypothetical protein